jgi:hypothetical protein
MDAALLTGVWHHTRQHTLLLLLLLLLGLGLGL